MKLVGATDWFIRWPFVIEGMVVGAAGALLAIAVLGVAKVAAARPAGRQLDADRGAADDRVPGARGGAAGRRRAASRRSARALAAALPARLSSFDGPPAGGLAASGGYPQSDMFAAHVHGGSRRAVVAGRSHSSRSSSGIWLGGHPSWLPIPLRSAFVADQQASDQIVRRRARPARSSDYYRPVNRSQLVNKGLAAAVASLNDPYSHYFDPSDYQSFQNETNPHLSAGSGSTSSPSRRGCEIVDVFPGSPAARAGLVRGDVIIAVGSTSLGGPLGELARRLIRGRPGSRVTLTVQSRAPARASCRSSARDITVPVASGRVLNYHGVQDRLSAADQLHRRVRSAGSARQVEQGAPSRARRRWSSICARTAAGCSRRRSTSPASSSPTARSSRPTGARSHARSTSPRAARSRPRSRWSCWSTTAPRRPPRS